MRCRLAITLRIGGTGSQQIVAIASKHCHVVDVFQQEPPVAFLQKTSYYFEIPVDFDPGMLVTVGAESLFSLQPRRSDRPNLAKAMIATVMEESTKAALLRVSDIALRCQNDMNVSQLCPSLANKQREMIPELQTKPNRSRRLFLAVMSRTT